MPSVSLCRLLANRIFQALFTVRNLNYKWFPLSFQERLLFLNDREQQNPAELGEYLICSREHD